MKKKERGAVIVEFALVLPLFLFILFLAIYGALWLHDVNALNEVTRAAVRYGAVETSGTEASDKHNNIENYIYGTNGMNVNDVLILYGDDSHSIRVDGKEDDEGNLEDVKVNDEPAVQVTLVAKKKEALPLIVDSLIPDKISSTLTMRIE